MKKTIKISALITALFLSASVWAADWNSTAVYVGGDTVSYQGKTYTAKWWTTGEAPVGNSFCYEHSIDNVPGKY